MNIYKKPAGKNISIVRGNGAVTLRKDKLFGTLTVIAIAVAAAFLAIVAVGNGIPASAQTSADDGPLRQSGQVVGYAEGSDVSYCDLDGLRNCEDGELHITNRGSALTTDPEVRRGQDRDEVDEIGGWQLGTDREYIGSSSTLYASVVDLQDNRNRDDRSGDLAALPFLRADNYVIEDYDRVIVTVIDDDRNPLTEEITTLTVNFNTVDGSEVVQLDLSQELPIYISRGNPISVAVDNPIDATEITGNPTWEVNVVGAQDHNFVFSGVRSQTGFASTYLGTFSCAPRQGQSDCVVSAEFTITWNRATVNTVDVEIESTGGRLQILKLRETNIDTGIFEGEIKLIDNLDDRGDELGDDVPYALLERVDNTLDLPVAYIYASDRDTVDVTYEDQTSDESTPTDTANVDPRTTDRNQRFRVDTSEPEAEITSPADDVAVDDRRPVFEGTFTDDTSGIAGDEIAFIVDDGNSRDIVATNLQEALAPRIGSLSNTFTGRIIPDFPSNVDAINNAADGIVTVRNSGNSDGTSDVVLALTNNQVETYLNDARRFEYMCSGSCEIIIGGALNGWVKTGTVTRNVFPRFSPRDVIPGFPTGSDASRITGDTVTRDTDRFTGFTNGEMIIDNRGTTPAADATADERRDALADDFTYTCKADSCIIDEGAVIAGIVERDAFSSTLNVYPEGYEPFSGDDDTTDRGTVVGTSFLVNESSFDDGDRGDPPIQFRIDRDVYEDEFGSLEYTPDNRQVLRYQVYGVDLAGNIGFSDSDTDEDDPQAHRITVDSEAADEADIGAGDAITGREWDASDAEIVTARDSLLLVFPERLDASTVQPADFRYLSSRAGVSLTVEEVTLLKPDDVDDEDLNGNGLTGSDDVAVAIPNLIGNTSFSGIGSGPYTDEDLEDHFVLYIFLRLSGDIPSDDEPTIRIVGNVDDRAGNRISTGFEYEDIRDGIAPQITSVTLSEGSGIDSGGNTRSDSLTKDDITVQIEVDEDVRTGDIDVLFYQDRTPSGGGSGDDAQFFSIDEGGTPSRVSGQTNKYELDYTASSSLDGGDDGSSDGDDVYVVVELVDRDGNRTIFGAEEATDSSGNVTGPGPVARRDDANVLEQNGRPVIGDLDDFADNLSFTLDNTNPILDNDGNGQAAGDDNIIGSDPRMRLVIQFLEEIESIQSAEVDLAGDGVLDITADLISSDGETWVYTPATDWILGNHQVNLELRDLADNDVDLDFDFEIVERKPFTLSLRRGWNAISFPSDPLEATVTAVFSEPGITQVVAYQPFSRNPWRISTRSGNTFSGDIPAVQGGVGYWVFSENFTDITVILETAGEREIVGAVPSNIRTSEGWNLIGVLDPVRDRDVIEGDSGDALEESCTAGVGRCGSGGTQDYKLGDYLTSAGADITQVYSYDTINNRFDAEDYENVATTGPDAEVGLAYWIYIDVPAGGTAPPIAP